MFTRLGFGTFALSVMCFPARSQAPKPGPPCKLGEPHPLAIVIDHAPAEVEYPGGQIHIVFKNVSDHTITVLRANPEVLYLADVVDSAGRKVPLTEAGRGLYAPPTSTSVYASSGLGITYVDLAPGQESQISWSIASYFDISKPDKYRVTVSRTFLGKSICSNTGSEQEFDWTRILGRFLEDYKFGPGRRHALRLQEEIAQILGATTAAQQ